MNLVHRIILLLSMLASPAFAKGIAVRFGPLGAGNGGTNPTSIPLAFQEIAASYITDKDIEYNMSLTAWAIAKREKAKWGGYVSLGAGLALSTVDVGLGPYAAFGYEGGCLFQTLCYSIEYQQAVGFTAKTVVSPYSVHMGAVVWF